MIHVGFDILFVSQMFKIPFQFFESISPLSETNDVVHNVFLNTQYMRYCDVIHITIQYMFEVLYLFQNETYFLT